MKKIILRIIIICAIIGVAFVLAAVSCNLYITKNANGRTYDSVDKIPYNKVGLLLGTSRTTKVGRENRYFTYRIHAAVELYFAKKISYILVSGDNHIKAYNEPEDMKNALVEAGIPADVIYLDYAGFRTLDSIIRAKKIFGQSSITIISQRWHNERAIYLADQADVKAVAYNARDVTRKRSYVKNHAREIAARVKAIIDVIFHKNPKFLGEEVEIAE